MAKKRDKLRKWESFCRKLGEKPAHVGLAWLLANPVVTAPIVGPRTIDQLTANLRALDIRLNPEAMAKLDAIFPGPGGEAPKPYAW